MAAKQRRESDGDGDDDGVELSSVPRSRAPSYVSTRSQRSFWDGHDDADEALLPSRSKWSPDVKGPRGVETTVRTVSQTSTFTSSREKRYRLQGWRFGVTVSAWTALVVFLFNLILTIWAAVRFPVVDGIGTALDGACGQVNTWTTWLHVLINGLSSLLLSASNYTMQCLCSPTRKEIDRAHARGDWLDVGVPSVRNISRVNWRRTVLWGLLAASTVPIHLLYNSAIFKTLEANDYYMIVANTDFLQGDAFAAWYNESSTNYQIQDMYDFSPDGPNGQWSTYQYVRDVQLQFANASAYANDSSVHNLTNSECMTVYGTSYVSNYRNVLAITSAKGNQTNNTLFYYEVNNVIGSGLAYGWICEDSWDRPYGVMTCDIGRAKRDSMNWSIHGRRIEYCLAQVAAPHCKLQFSTQILTTVIVMNACKAICMFLTLWRQKDATLVTVGDAMSSFLDCPDELTRGRCLMSKVDVGKGPLRWRLRGNEDKPNTEPLPITYHAPLRRRWFSAASANRWCVAVGLCIAALIAGGSLLGMGVANLRNYGSTSTAFTMGFGNIDSRTMISSTLPQDGSSGLVSAVLLANSPQSIVSFIYLTYNALFTCMLLSQEYSKHGLANQKKPLRVTTPHGQQRKSWTTFDRSPGVLTDYRLDILPAVTLLVFGTSLGRLGFTPLFDISEYLPRSHQRLHLPGQDLRRSRHL